MGEKIVVVGFRSVEFTDEKTHKVVKGTSFYYTMKADGVVGSMAGKMFLSDMKLAGLDYVPAVGDECLVYYDRFGKPGQFVKLSK